MIISFYTLGCRLNQAEEESLRRAFMEGGWFVSTPDKAQICVVNTCSVTALADKKTKRALRSLKTDNPLLELWAIGCGAERARDYPEVDFWVPNSDKNRVHELISSQHSREASYASSNGTNVTQGPTETKRTRALLKVQDGCNNHCAYCIVPSLRGPECSLATEDLVREAKKLRNLGYQELVISGVNVGKYNTSGKDLKGLLRDLLNSTDYPRIRLSSINPQDIDEELIRLWAENERLSRHFHISLQSGSDGVLKRMGRPYTAQKYYSLANNIIQMIPEMAITTDVIVGFPGETKQEHRETVDFIRSIGFAKLHVFRYSKRKGTKAAEMAGQVIEELKRERSRDLLKIGKETNKKFIQKYLNKELEVLFEENKEGVWSGISSNYIRVKVSSGEELANKLRRVKIKKLRDGYLEGVLL